MKNSRIVLGASAFVLAIAGAFVTKASNRAPIHSAATKVNCNFTIQRTCEPVVHTNKCRTGGVGSKTLYTHVAGVTTNDCKHTLYTKVGQ